MAVGIALAGCGSSDESDSPERPERGAAATAPRDERPSDEVRAARANPSPELDRRLIEAARGGDVDAARELIEAGADVNAKDETEQSAFLLARARAIRSSSS